jgi:hypothetical protein
LKQKFNRAPAEDDHGHTMNRAVVVKADFPAWILYPAGAGIARPVRGRPSLKTFRWNGMMPAAIRSMPQPRAQAARQSPLGAGWACARRKIRQRGHWWEDGELHRGSASGDYLFQPANPDRLPARLSSEVGVELILTADPAAHLRFPRGERLGRLGSVGTVVGRQYFNPRAPSDEHQYIG